MAQIDNLPSSFRKHVATIHCSATLTLLERKISNVLLLHAYDKLLVDREHRIPLSLLNAMLGYDSHDTAYLRKSLTSLVTTALEFNLLDDRVSPPNAEKPLRGKKSSEPWGVAGLLSRGEIVDGVCYYAYDEKLAERLFDPEVYAMINVAVQRRFESAFTLNLHENCLRFKGVGKTGWWDLPKFRKLVGATAVTFNKFRLLNDRVIKPSVIEINKHSEIMIEPEFEHGPGRGAPVIAVRFIIKENPQLALFHPTYEDHNGLRDLEEYKQLRYLGASDRLALDAVMHDREWAGRVAEVVTARVKSGNVKKSGAYVSKMITERADMGPAAIEREIQSDRKKQEQLQSLGQKQKQESRELEARRNKATVRFAEHRRTRAVAEASEEVKRAAVKEFIASSDAVAARLWDESTARFKSPSWQVRYQIFLADKLFGAYTDEDALTWFDAEVKAGRQTI